MQAVTHANRQRDVSMLLAQAICRRRFGTLIGAKLTSLRKKLDTGVIRWEGPTPSQWPMDRQATFARIIDFYRLSLPRVLAHTRLSPNRNLSSPKIHRTAYDYFEAHGYTKTVQHYAEHVRSRYERDEVCANGLLNMLYFGAIALLCHLDEPSDSIQPDAKAINDALHLLQLLHTANPDEWAGSLLDFDPILLQDPAMIYMDMDVHTKNSYRLAVMELANETGLATRLVAHEALMLCAGHPITKNVQVRAHIGYYLVDQGHQILLNRLGRTAPARSRSRSQSECTKRRTIVLMTAELTLAIVLGSLAIAPLVEASNPVEIFGLATCLAVLAVESAKELTKKAILFLMHARRLPSMAGDALISACCRTAICIPTVLTDQRHVSSIVASLEQNYRSSIHADLKIILLVDFQDASNPEITPEEQGLIADLEARLGELNSTYGDEGRRPFLMAWRHRVYSKTQNAWMGYERKRGKIEALFNHIIDGSSELTFAGDAGTDLAHIDFVLVIDDDTRLTPGALQIMSATISHPLNRCRVDPDTVTHGHGVIVPTVREGAIGSAINFHSDSPLFNLSGQCNFAGKGIYDVRFCHAMLQGKFPSERILAHDTFEGFWIRPGFCHNATVLEAMPSNYIRICERRHRWMRGDWQNFTYASKRIFSSKINIVSWYVMIGQLLNMLAPTALTVSVLIALIFRAQTFETIVLVMALAYFGTWTDIIGDIFRAHYHGLTAIARRRMVARFLYVLTELLSAPQRGMLYLDAVLRSSYRLLTRRQLLQWRTAHQTERADEPPSLAIRYAWLASMLSLAILMAFIVVGGAPVSGMIFLALWALSPVLLIRLL